MKKSTLSLTIVAGSLIASSAMADYTGLTSVNSDNGDGTWTAQIYANFSAATDELDAVFGDAQNALSISTSGMFYQNALGGATSQSINPALIPLFPSLALDSWVTIGRIDQTDNALLNIGIDFSGFEAGGSISTDNGSWFATPDDPQVLAGADLRVLVGQFTMMGMDDNVSGVLNLQGKAGDFVTFQARDQAFDFAYGMVPAPGALALLGLAGVASRRRRK
ncbi:MAG: PEP-CTERM sorting domain-containing protein [Phycisphaerales bacterium]|tara:strand:- start:1213 stop:1875 length:663 start_codon:yes stop_codon:yes gene_type:complete